MKRANRIASWGLAGAVVLLLASEEHARRTWKSRAVSNGIEIVNLMLENSALRLKAENQAWYLVPEKEDE